MKRLADNPNDFLRKSKKLDTQRVPAKMKTTLLCLYAPQAGMYSIVVPHDKNGNSKLSLNRFGLQLEGFGCSINLSIFLDFPPNSEEAAFSLITHGLRIGIDLGY
ncbi:MAG: DUF2141 domain-containing protein [Nitrospirales bacterium]